MSDAPTDASSRLPARHEAGASPDRHRLLGPLVAIALSVSFAIAYHAGTLEPGERSLLNLDDGYIHARLAENLVGTGTLGINPGAGGGGSSSLLWTLLVSSGVALGLRGDLAAGLLSVLSLILAVGVASRLCFDLLRPAPAWIASIAVAASGQTVALGLSGMESLLFAGLVIAGLRDAMLGRRWNGALFFCVAAGVRVEAVLAALACFGVGLVGTERRSEPGRLTRGSVRLLAVVSVAALAVLALAALGHGWPSTLAARRWLYGMGEGLLPGREQWTGVIPLLLRDLWLRLSAVQGPGHLAGHAWAGVVAALAGVGCIAALRARALAALPVYVVLQTAFVVIVLGSDSHLSRYLAPVWLLMPLMVAQGWGVIAERIRFRFVTIPVLALLLALYVPQALRWAGWHRGAVRHLRDVHLEMTSRIAEVVPVGEPVAAFDIGLLSYVGGRHVVDVGGLTDPEIARAMRRAQVPNILERRGVRYVVFPEPNHPGPRYVFATRLGFDPGRLGAPLERTTVRARDLSYLGPTRVAMPALALYELRR